MGCNCGGKQAGKEWVYTPPQNATGAAPKVYKTEVEARAAQIRNGGGTITTRTK